MIDTARVERQRNAILAALSRRSANPKRQKKLCAGARAIVDDLVAYCTENLDPRRHHTIAEHGVVFDDLVVAICTAMFCMATTQKPDSAERLLQRAHDEWVAAHDIFDVRRDLVPADQTLSAVYSLALHLAGHDRDGQGALWCTEHAECLEHCCDPFESTDRYLEHQLVTRPS